MERPLFFVATILQISPDLSNALDIRRRTQGRLSKQVEEKCNELMFSTAQDTEA